MQGSGRHLVGGEIKKRNTVALKEPETMVKKKKVENNDDGLMSSPSELYPSKIGSWVPPQNSDNTDLVKQRHRVGQNIPLLKNTSPIKIPMRSDSISNGTSSISPVKARHQNFRSGKNSESSAFNVDAQ